VKWKLFLAYLLLLHQLCIGTVVHNITAKDWRCEWAVHLFCIDISQLSVQNEIVAFRAQAYRCLLSKQYECEDIAILLAASEEELERVNAVCDGAANERHPVKDERWFVWISIAELSKNIYEDREGDECPKTQSNYLPCARG
jgi:hypothetical protein